MALRLLKPAKVMLFSTVDFNCSCADCARGPSWNLRICICKSSIMERKPVCVRGWCTWDMLIALDLKPDVCISVFSNCLMISCPRWISFMYSKWRSWLSMSSVNLSGSWWFYIATDISLEWELREFQDLIIQYLRHNTILLWYWIVIFIAILHVLKCYIVAMPNIAKLLTEDFPYYVFKIKYIVKNTPLMCSQCIEIAAINCKYE